MSGKTDRRIRKGINALKLDEQAIADSLVAELINSPFKYRFLFAMKILFRRR
jgi:hypothetical protein